MDAVGSCLHVTVLIYYTIYMYVCVCERVAINHLQLTAGLPVIRHIMLTYRDTNSDLWIEICVKTEANHA